MEPWSYYAMSSGAGHLMRGLSLARVAPVPMRLIVPQELPVEHRNVTLVVSGHESPVALLEGDPQVILVDTFPFGEHRELLGLLRAEEGKRLRVFVARRCSPGTYHAAQVRSLFDLILIPGPYEVGIITPDEQARVTEGWTIRDRGDVPQCPRDITFISGVAHREGMLPDVWRELKGRHHSMRFLSFETPSFIGEGYDCYRALTGMMHLGMSKVVIAAATAAGVYEPLALGLPTLLVPFQQRYDPHLARALAANADHPDRIHVYDSTWTSSQTADVIEDLASAGVSPDTVLNGVYEAVALIERALDDLSLRRS